jgi:ribosomal protein S18 acetylase RimI-like enzyme
VINDPNDEIVRLVQAAGDDPSPAQRQAAGLVRRRFGLALPPPFVDRPRSADARRGVASSAADAAAVAAVKWRSWRSAYRGIVPDDFLDRLPVYPSAAYWVGLSARPRSQHVLMVAGRRGEVHGMCSAGPTSGDGLDPQQVGEVSTLYIDPSAQGRGLGARLLDAVVDQLLDIGFDDVRLWVLRDNEAARRFYERRGWVPDGAEQAVPLNRTDVALAEVRYRWSAADGLLSDI